MAFLPPAVVFQGSRGRSGSPGEGLGQFLGGGTLDRAGWSLGGCSVLVAATCGKSLCFQAHK